MLIRLSDLELRRVAFDTAFQPGSLDLSRTKFQAVNKMHIAGAAELRGGVKEIRIAGHIVGKLTAECDRCLEPAPLVLDRDFDLTYRPDSMDNDASATELDPAESEIGYYEGESVKLADVLTEQVLLWLPMHFVCGEDCKGICPECGVNRNTTACNCRVERVDERWAALKDFKPSARKP